MNDKQNMTDIFPQVSAKFLFDISVSADDTYIQINIDGFFK